MKRNFLLFFLMFFSLGQSQKIAAWPTVPPARNALESLRQYSCTKSNQIGVAFFNSTKSSTNLTSSA